jgi:hypothetical protein
MLPRPGDVVRIGREASVQFAGERSLVLRVTVVSDRPTYEGWAWLTGYVLDAEGQAIDRREVFVQVAGVSLLQAIPVGESVRSRSTASRVRAARSRSPIPATR